MNNHKQLTANFNSSEFDSPDEPYSGNKMNYHFMLKLQVMREIAGVRFDITSGYRTPAHNKEVSGKSDSEHLYGKASDIKCNNSVMRAHLIKSAILAGFTRIGIGRTFIHVDDSGTKPQQVYWVY